MNDKIMVISDQAKDGNLFKQILGSKGFDIVTKPILEGIEDILSDDNFGAISQTMIRWEILLTAG